MRELLIDAWTALDFKRLISTSRLGPSVAGPSLIPTWTGRHQRRLQAYAMLRAYRENSSRFFLDTQDETQREDHREYGDAELLVQQVRAALLGDQIRITVPGADEINPDAADEAALARQEWLRNWADGQRFNLKIMETEGDAVGLGDGVYVLGWDAKRNRVRMRCFDPGFYFPVLSPDIDDDEYPDRVHLAWELPEEDSPPDRRLIRRITYELMPVAEYTPAYSDRPSDMECFLTDATYEVDAFQSDVEDLTPARARYRSDELGEINQRALGIDFIPVVHVPNTVALKDHFGKSVLTTVLQIVDDLSNADTDLQAASATAGTPALALAGSTLGKEPRTYGPGTVFETGDGRMTVLDTTAGVTAIIDYVKFLLSRLSTNARVPESVLGRVDPAQIEAGVILQLTFGPLTTMIEEMRLVRNEKYPLLLKFLQRFYVQAGELPDVMPANLQFGAYLPHDDARAVQQASTLFGASIISLPTAIRILVEAGMPIDDATTELERIIEMSTRKQEATLALQQRYAPEPTGEPNGNLQDDGPRG